MTACGAVGALIIDGREVAALRCEREAGHDQPDRCHVRHASVTEPCAVKRKSDRRRLGTDFCAPRAILPHAFTFEWRDVIEAPDMDLLDPDEELVGVPMPDDEP